MLLRRTELIVATLALPVCGLHVLFCPSQLLEFNRQIRAERWQRLHRLPCWLICGNCCISSVPALSDQYIQQHHRAVILLHLRRFADSRASSRSHFVLTNSWYCDQVHEQHAMHGVCCRHQQSVWLSLLALRRRTVLSQHQLDSLQRMQHRTLLGEVSWQHEMHSVCRGQLSVAGWSRRVHQLLERSSCACTGLDQMHDLSCWYLCSNQPIARWLRPLVSTRFLAHLLILCLLGLLLQRCGLLCECERAVAMRTVSNW